MPIPEDKMTLAPQPDHVSPAQNDSSERMKKFLTAEKSKALKTVERQLKLFEIEGIPKTPAGTSPMNNHLARTALFSPIPRRKRKMCNNELLVSQDDAEIRFTGEKLDMTDQDVFLEALRRAGGTLPTLVNDPNTGSSATEFVVEVSRYEFLKSLHLSINGKTYKLLEKSFERLAEATIKIITPNYITHYHLLGFLRQDLTTGNYVYTIPKPTLHLLISDNFGYVNMERRQLLESNVDLAKWLQSFASSHRKGHKYQIRVKRLYELINMETRYRDFKNRAWNALKELQRVGELKEIAIRVADGDDVVEWIRE